MRKSLTKLLITLLALSLCVGLCGCSNGGGGGDLKYHQIFGAGLLGAAVGGIVGHQSDECGAGVAIGAAVFATGDLLCQIDRLNEKKVREAEDKVAQGDDLLSLTAADR
jgi:hypothetical protein